MSNDKNVFNESRRQFLKGKISTAKNTSSRDSLEFDVGLIKCSRTLISESRHSLIGYRVINTGAKRISILVKYVSEHPQIIKMVHLAPNEQYNGTWTETPRQSEKRCSIIIEARCEDCEITRCCSFDAV